MNFSIRPSKSFLFDFLEKKLRKINGNIGLDAASAVFKNREMFETDKYFGLDIDLLALKKAIIKNKIPNTYGLWGDLTKLDKLPNNSVDVVVSTNTLYIFQEERLGVVKELSRIVAPAGTFLFQVPLDGHFEKIKNFLVDNFKEIEIIYFRNFFSKCYEMIFEREGYLGTHPVAGLKVFRFLSWLIGRLEYATKGFAFLNSEAFFICKDKKEKGAKQNFDLSKFSLVEEKIYSFNL